MRRTDKPAIRPGARPSGSRRDRPGAGSQISSSPRRTHQPTGKRPELLTGLILVAALLFVLEVFVGLARESLPWTGMLLSVVWMLLIVGTMRRSEEAYKAARFVAYLGLVLNGVFILTSFVEYGTRVDLLELFIRLAKLGFNGAVLGLFPQPRVRDWVLYG